MNVLLDVMSPFNKGQKEILKKFGYNKDVVEQSFVDEEIVNLMYELLLEDMDHPVEIRLVGPVTLLISKGS